MYIKNMRRFRFQPLRQVSRIHRTPRPEIAHLNQQSTVVCNEASQVLFPPYIATGDAIPAWQSQPAERPIFPAERPIFPAERLIFPAERPIFPAERLIFPPVPRSSSSTEPVVICPHCQNPIIIAVIACGIFRHGYYKETLQQLPPHASKTVCDQAVADGLIWGCGKPFRFNGKTVEICDYI